MIEYWKNLDLRDLFYINDDGLVCCEEWRDIIGYEGLYKISNLGRRKNKFNKIQKPRIKKGYNTARLFKNGAYREFLTHRIVAESFIPNPKNKPCVNHINGIKNDNRIKNLEWCTISENVIHSFANNLLKKRLGADNNFTKLTQEQVLEIRELYSLGFLFQKQIAKIYNIKKCTVSSIVTKKNWKHL